MKDRMEILLSPEADAIRNRTKAAQETNRREFEAKVDAIPGLREAWNDWKSRLDESNRLWDKYEKLIRPLRMEFEAVELRIYHEDSTAKSKLISEKLGENHE